MHGIIAHMSVSMHPIYTLQECSGAQNATGRIHHACCLSLPKHQGNKTSRMQGWWEEQLPPRTSSAAHLRSGGASEPAIHPSGSGGAQAIRLAHRSRSCENRPGLTARLAKTCFFRARRPRSYQSVLLIGFSRIELPCK